MKTLACLFIVFSLFLFGTTKAQAKLLPQAQKPPMTTKKAPASAYTGLTVSAKLRSDRKAIIINFGNLQSVSSVSYSLIYEHDGQQEGAGGTVSETGNTATRELLFGTCSHGVCRYHTNIKNAKLEITYKTKAGKTYLKRYRIKV